jgi:hypothetical protein
MTPPRTIAHEDAEQDAHADRVERDRRRTGELPNDARTS